jgi:hypothetical protein
VTFASGFTGVPSYDSATGILEIGAFRYPNFVDLASPILTFRASILDETQPSDVRITSTIVDNSVLPDTLETFDFSTVELSATVTDRFERALGSVEVSMYEASGGDQFYVREVGDGASETVFEIVVRPGSDLSAIDFELTDQAGLGTFELSSALTGWTAQTNMATPGKVVFSGFAALDGSQDIGVGEETVVATFTSGAAPVFTITGIALDGSAQQDVYIGAVEPSSKNGHVTHFELGRGSEMLVLADKEIDVASDRAIGAYDALQALRLSVGLSKSNGKAEWHDFIAADINKDGRVGADDALNILKFAVGVTGGPSADWVFVDGDADWSGIGRRSSGYDEGIRLEDVLADHGVNLIGILVGDVDGSYAA